MCDRPFRLKAVSQLLIIVIKKPTCRLKSKHPLSKTIDKYQKEARRL